MDIGMRLIDMAGDGDFDVYEVMDDINMALEKHGLRAKHFGKWENFVDSCIKEKEFIENLISIVGEKDKD